MLGLKLGTNSLNIFCAINYDNKHFNCFKNSHNVRKKLQKGDKQLLCTHHMVENPWLRPKIFLWLLSISLVINSGAFEGNSTRLLLGLPMPIVWKSHVLSMFYPFTH